MARVADTVPVRIATICRNTVVPCPGSQLGEPPHALANSRFMVMLYMIIGGPDLPPPFNRGTHDPPVEVQMIETMSPTASRFLSILHHN